MVIGWRAPERLPRRRQRHVDALGDEHRGVSLGTQRREPLVVAALRLAARDVDPPPGVGAISLRQRSQRLAGQRDRRAVAQVLGLGPGQRVEVARQVEGVAGRADRFGQRFVRQIGLIDHPAIIGDSPDCDDDTRYPHAVMIRPLIIAVIGVAAVLVAVLALRLNGWWAVPAAVLLALAALGTWDLVQTRHTMSGS